MKKEDCFLLGRFGKLIGNKGEISIRVDVDDPEIYNKMGSVFALIGENLVPFFFEASRRQGKDKLVVKLEDFQEPDDLRPLIGKELYLPMAALPPLPKGEFYLHELVNANVKDVEFGDVGTVIGIIDQSAQPLAEVSYQNMKYLIPLVDEILLNFDKQNSLMEVQLPEGLIDLGREENH